MKAFLKKIFDNLHRIAKDNTLHFLAGFIVAAIVIVVEIWIIKANGFRNGLFLIPYFSIPFAAMVWVALAAAWKEIWWDGRLEMGVPSWSDFRTTIIGGLACAIPVWVIVWGFTLLPKDAQLQPTNKQILINAINKLEHIHDNDPASFDNNSKELKDRSDSLLNRVIKAGDNQKDSIPIDFN